MAKAVLCPVCQGSGVVAERTDLGATLIYNTKTCHGCYGRGWVEVSEDVVREPCFPEVIYWRVL